MSSVAAIAGSSGSPPPWWILIRLEALLTWRDITAFSRGRGPSAKAKKAIGRKRFIFNLVAAAILLHAIGFATLILPRHWPDSQPARLAAVFVMVLLFTLMLSTAMSRIVAAFHERRDLDLLLGAPIAPSVILGVRAASVVVAVTAMFGIFVVPIANVGVVTGHWWMARLYLLLPLTALVSTAIALMLSGAVVRAIGARRARVGLQVFSAVIGASMYFVSQARQFLPAETSARWSHALLDIAGAEHPAWPIAFMIRIAAGDPLPWVGFGVASVAIFAAAVAATQRRFVEVAQTPEADARVATPDRSRVERRIVRGFGRGIHFTLLQKEWRLILRAPQLISQILLQLLYLTPLIFIAYSQNGGRVTWSNGALAAGVVGLAGTLATSLTWLTVAAEDAPDLIAGSPQARATILVTKLAAATIPPMVLVTLVALGVARHAPVDGAIVLVFGALACLSAAIVAAAVPSSGKRSDFQRRHQGRGLHALAEALQFLLWAGASGTAASGFWLVSAALVVSALVMPAIYLRRALHNVAG